MLFRSIPSPLSFLPSPSHSSTSCSSWNPSCNYLMTQRKQIFSFLICILQVLLLLPLLLLQLYLTLFLLFPNSLPHPECRDLSFCLSILPSSPSHLIYSFPLVLPFFDFPSSQTLLKQFPERRSYHNGLSN